MNDLFDVIGRAWSWVMPSPERVLRINKFGNVLVSAADGFVWRICPEEVSCEQLSRARAGEDVLFGDAGFREDWEMTKLVELAEGLHGVQPDGRCFCLKIPCVLGGEYAVDNIMTRSVCEVVELAGDLGLKIRDLPDGAQVQLDVDD